MKKPKEAIERMRSWVIDYGQMGFDRTAILAWADSIPDDAVWVVWPSSWPKKSIEVVANDLDSDGGYEGAVSALRALSAIAPKRKKRMVDIWEHSSGSKAVWDSPLEPEMNVHGWRKVGGPFEIEE